MTLHRLISKISSSNPVLATLFSLFGDSLAYLAGASLIGLGNFVLLPLYTRYLNPAEFGTYALVDIAIQIVNIVSLLGLGVSYLKWFASLDASQHGKLLGSTLLVGWVSATIGGGLLTLGIVSRLGELWLQRTERDFVWMLLPIIVLESTQTILLTDLRAHRKAVVYSSVTVARLLGIVGFSLWFIVVQQKGILGIFSGRLVGDAISVAVLLITFFRSSRLKFSLSTAKPLIRYGLPIVSSALIASLLDATGRSFLNQYSTLEQVGYYGAAIKIANIFQVFITQPFGVAWGGLMFQIARWPNAHLVYSKISAYIFAFSLSAALILSLLSPTIFIIFTSPEYFPAITVFPALLIVRAINIMEYPASIGIYLANQTKWFLPFYLTGLSVNILLNYLLVPVYGMHGAAFAWLASWIVITSLIAWKGQKYYQLQYNNWKLFVIPVALWCAYLMARNCLAAISAHFQWIIQVGGTFSILIIVGVMIFKDVKLVQKNLGGVPLSNNSSNININ
jgi:O-antigen/teichoic acid export membrane protein